MLRVFPDFHRKRRGYFTKIMQRVPVKISLPRLDSPERTRRAEVVFRIGMQGTIEIQL